MNKLVLVAGFLASISVVKGVVFKLLWGWFVVPLGVPHLSLPIAVGIGLLVSFLVIDKSYLETNEEKNKNLERLVFPFLFCATVLLFGWLTHFFV